MKTININGKEFTIEELNALIEGSKGENLDRGKEEKFLELFQGLEMKSDIEKYPNSVFFFRGDKCILEKEKHYLWVSYNRIWKIFEDEFGMDYGEIQTFIKSMVEKHFKMTEVTPVEVICYFFDIW